MQSIDKWETVSLTKSKSTFTWRIRDETNRTDCRQIENETTDYLLGDTGIFGIGSF